MNYTRKRMISVTYCPSPSHLLIRCRRCPSCLRLLSVGSPIYLSSLVHVINRGLLTWLIYWRHRKRKCDGKKPCFTCRESNADCVYQELPSDRYERPMMHRSTIRNTLLIIEFHFAGLKRAARLRLSTDLAESRLFWSSRVNRSTS